MPSPTLTPLPINLAVIVVSFFGFLVVGTLLFVRKERNR